MGSQQSTTQPSKKDPSESFGGEPYDDDFDDFYEIGMHAKRIIAQRINAKDPVNYGINQRFTSQCFLSLIDKTRVYSDYLDLLWSQDKVGTKFKEFRRNAEAVDEVAKLCRKNIWQIGIESDKLLAKYGRGSIEANYIHTLHLACIRILDLDKRIKISQMPANE